MTLKAVWISVLAALVASAPVDLAFAAKKKYAPLKGTQYLTKRPGGYSYKYSDSINTRKFNDPAFGPQAQGQPFDNGFFFATPTGTHGGDTPYMH